LTTLEEQYEELSDEALLEILAEGPEHYRAEALTAARNEARSRGLDFGEATGFNLPARRSSRFRRFFGCYLIFNGYGMLVGLPFLLTSVAEVGGFGSAIELLLPLGTDPSGPSAMAAAISVAANLLFIVRLRHHAWKGTAGSA